MCRLSISSHPFDMSRSRALGSIRHLSKAFSVTELRNNGMHVEDFSENYSHRSSALTLELLRRSLCFLYNTGLHLLPFLFLRTIH